MSACPDPRYDRPMSHGALTWIAGLVIVASMACGAASPDDPDATAAGSSGDATTDATGSTATMTTTSTSGTAATSSTTEASSDAGDASSESTDSGDTSGTESGGAALSFEADVWPVYAMERDPPLSGRTTTCVGCHAGGAGGLVTPDAATTYANLIDTAATSAFCVDQLRVVAGDPDASCFLAFYEVRIRDELGWADQAETDLVRAWILAGAAP